MILFCSNVSSNFNSSSGQNVSQSQSRPNAVAQPGVFTISSTVPPPGIYNQGTRSMDRHINNPVITSNSTGYAATSDKKNSNILNTSTSSRGPSSKPSVQYEKGKQEAYKSMGGAPTPTPQQANASNGNPPGTRYVNMPRGKTSSGASDLDRRIPLQDSNKAGQDSYMVAQKSSKTGPSRTKQEYHSNNSLDRRIPLQGIETATRKTDGDSASTSSSVTLQGDSDLDQNIPMPDAEGPVRQQLYYPKRVSRSSDTESDIDRHIPFQDAEPVAKQNYYSKNMPKQTKTRRKSESESDLDRSIPMQDSERNAPHAYYNRRMSQLSHKSNSESDLDRSIHLGEDEPQMRQNYYAKNSRQSANKKVPKKDFDRSNELNRNIPMPDSEPSLNKKRTKQYLDMSSTPPSHVNPFADRNIDYIDMDSATSRGPSSKVSTKNVPPTNGPSSQVPTKYSPYSQEPATKYAPSSQVSAKHRLEQRNMNPHTNNQYTYV